MKKLFLALLLLLLLSLISLPQANGETNETRYIGFPTHTVNGKNARTFLPANSTTSVVTSKIRSGNWTVQWGSRLWFIHANGSQTEITSGSPLALMQRSTDGSSYQTNTWNVPNNVTILEDDALYLQVYINFQDAWQTLVDAVSGQLVAQTLLGNVTWTFKYYTEREYTANTTIGRIHWGSTTRYSRIENIQFQGSPVSTENNLAVGLILGLVIALPIALIFMLGRRH